MSRKQRPEKASSNNQFIGRTELLDWLNKTLDLHYKKVEDASNGAAFCQIVDMVHPGTVPLARLNFNALLPHECMENLKILQEVFTKNGITAIVDVASLSKGRYVAALNVLQFLYHYVKSVSSNNDKIEYDPVARRRSFHLPEHPAQPGKQPHENKAINPSLLKTVVSRGVPILDKTLKKKKAESNLSVTSANPKPVINSPQPDQDKDLIIAQLQKKCSNLIKKNKTLAEDYELITQERDFYYDKLRKVEEFCQDNENEIIYKKIIDILYETDEAHGFVAPDDAQSVGNEENVQDDFDQEAELPDILKS